jgi:3-methyladenine DNA glycosylase/8-oxoguanine DNA glycosylase
MPAAARVLFLAEALREREIAPAIERELLEEFFDRLATVHVRNPRVLRERGERRIAGRAGKDRAHPNGVDQLEVREMRDDVVYRPFPRGLRFLQIVVRHIANRFGEAGRKRAQQFECFVHVPDSHSYRLPFDWDLLLAWLGARAIPGIERVEDGVYERGSVRAWHRDGVVHATGAQQRVRRLFDLDADPAAIAATLSRDRMLAPLLRKKPGIRVPGAWDPFELAVRAIVGQQVSVAGARTVLGRIAAAHGLTPETLAGADIQGMPRKRAETIRVLARAVATKQIDLERDDLTQLPGIGPWTAEYIAMRLGNADAFPAGDLILRRHAGDLSERELRARAERWRPYRAYAAMLLWTR